MSDRPEQSLFDNLLLGIDQVRRAPSLRTNLHHTVMLTRGIKHGFALKNIAAGWLLNPHIGPRLDRGNHWQRMPMIGRANDHGIEIRLGKHLKIIFVF